MSQGNAVVKNANPAPTPEELEQDKPEYRTAEQPHHQDVVAGGKEPEGATEPEKTITEQVADLEAKRKSNSASGAHSTTQTEPMPPTKPAPEPAPTKPAA